MPDHLNLPWGKRKKHAKLLQLDKGENLQPGKRNQDSLLSGLDSFVPASFYQCPQGKNSKSDLTNCFLGSEDFSVLARRCDFLNIPKKATRHMAQNKAFTLLDKFRYSGMCNSMLTVMGSFCLTKFPLTCLIPVSREERCQFSFRGLGRQNSLCIMPMIFR